MQRVPEESILPLAEDSHRPWYLLGIVSFGTCGASNPGMFTRLGGYSSSNGLKIEQSFFTFKYFFSERRNLYHGYERI